MRIALLALLCAPLAAVAQEPLKPALLDAPKSAEPPKAEAPKAAEPPKAAAGPKAAAPSGSAGKVSGKVTIAGLAPKLAPLPVTKDTKICGVNKADEALVIG